MNSAPLSCRLPRSHYFQHWERREKFMNYESVHPSWILFAVEDGSFYYEIGESKGIAAFGDLVLCPPGKTFRRVVILPVKLFVIHLDWTNDEGNELAPSDLEQFPVGKITIRDIPRLRENYEMMRQIKKLHDRGARHKINHYVYDLWLMYCEECEGIAEQPDNAQKRLPRDPIAEKAMLLIQQPAFQNIQLKDVADSLKTSLSQLSKKFKKCYGMTPMQYLTSQRLEKARTLLLETKLTLDQISECCGYQNGFYLNRVFKKHMGMTPMQFRANHMV